MIKHCQEGLRVRKRKGEERAPLPIIVFSSLKDEKSKTQQPWEMREGVPLPPSHHEINTRSSKSTSVSRR